MKEEVNSKIMEGLTFVSMEDQEDGSALMTFDIEDSFKEHFCKLNGYKKFTKKRFEKWVIGGIEKGLELAKEEHNIKDEE